MTSKRQIRGEKYNVAELVHSAVATVDGQQLDIEAAYGVLVSMGHAKPAEELVTRYARETAILAVLSQKTGANFGSQIGKIDFSNIEKAIAGVNAYLNRRNAGHRARWNKR